jgi:putative hydrolase of the HAD superfamily
MVKPDPMIYLKICDLLGVEPKQVAFVGDGEDDEMEGAKAAGMTTILVRHEGAYSLSHPLDYSGLRIESLMELLQIFPSRL